MEGQSAVLNNINAIADVLSRFFQDQVLAQENPSREMNPLQRWV